MKAFNLRLGIVLASLTLAAPAFAQKPAESGGAPAGAADRSTGGGAGASSGGAVDRGGGGAVSSAGGGGASSSSSSSGSGGGDFMRNPSVSSVSSPSISVGDRGAREFAPQHRAGFSSGMSYSEGDQKATPRSSGGSGGSGSGGGTAVSRGGGSSSSGGASGSGGSGSSTRSGSSGDSGGARTTGRTRTGPAPEASAGAANNASGTHEVPSWSRPRGDRPTSGSAVDRTVAPPDRNGGNSGDRYGYYDPYGYYGNGYGNGYGYNNYNYYGYPYGYGMGYGLYSGFGWAPYYGDPFGDPYGGGYSSSGGYSTSYGRGEQGNLKLKVKPRGAKVYVDGYFVGYVEQFDGAFQKLALNTGRHKVEIKTEGFETAEFDVLINPQQTVTFQGDLKRIQ